MMFDIFLDEVDEIYNIINAPIDNVFKIMAIEKHRKAFNMDNATFSSTYIKLMEKENGKTSGVVYTPEEIANYMIDGLVGKEELISNAFIKILDPACGCGDIIISCYKRLKSVYEDNLEEINKNNGILLKEKDISKHIIDNNLFGFDIDERALKIMAIDLFWISGYYNSDNFKKQIF